MFTRTADGRRLLALTANTESSICVNIVILSSHRFAFRGDVTNYFKLNHWYART